MTPIRRTLWALSFVLPVVWAGLGSAQQSGSREGYRDRYGVLSERNIFMRERGRRFRPEPSSRPSSSRRAEDSYVLRGVVFEDGAYHAYVENLDRSAMLRLAVGEAVADGKIVQIELDSVEYEQAGRRTRVEIGRSLTGGQVAYPTSAPESSGSTTQPSAGPLLNPNDPNLTLEQRMKLRRQQQMGGK